MQYKYLEIRDSGTCMPALAILMNLSLCDTVATKNIISRAGYSGAGDQVLLIFLEINQCHYNAYKWDDRTRHTAHLYIEDNWGSLHDGSIIDVEFILGETDTIKTTDLGDY